MGNLIPTIVFEDEDEDEIAYGTSDMSLRERQLMEIRANNLKKMRACSGQDQFHSHAIVEDAALEDLCEEAGVEAEKIEVNGKMNTKEKNKVLTHLSQNVQTKKHFQNKQTLQEYIDSKIYGDEKTEKLLVDKISQSVSHRCIPHEKSQGNNLTVDYNTILASSGSNLFKHGSKTLAGIPMKSLHARTSETNCSVEREIDPIRAAQYKSNQGKKQSALRQGSVLNSRQSNTRQQRQSKARQSSLRQSNMARQSGFRRNTGRQRSTDSRLFSRTTSNLPAYSSEERRQMHFILKSNQQTINMAEKMTTPKNKKISCFCTFDWNSSWLALRQQKLFCINK